MEPATLTQTLAIWGAVTGTIGTLSGIASLSLRIKQHKKDQPKLVCTSDFSFEHYPGGAKPKNKLVVRSIGKRPVTIDFIRYYLKPKGFWFNLFKNRTWQSGRWVYDAKPRNTIQITEGRKEDISISLPDAVHISEVLKVAVHDQSGIIWVVEWPNAIKLKKITNYESLYNTEESSDKRSITIHGYTVAGSYHIYAQWRNKPNGNTTNGKYFHFKSKREYLDKLDDINRNQKQSILNCESDEII